MPEVLPASFIGVLSAFGPVFTAPSFANFCVVVAGWVHALGRHRLSDVVRAAGALACKQYGAYYRFFSRACWSLDELGLGVLALVLATFGDAVVELDLDDTLSRRKGKKVALGTMHPDPVLRTGGKPFMSYGHVFVVLAVHVLVPQLACTGWALPFMFRLFESSKWGGQKDAPSQRKRKQQRRRRGVAKRCRQRLADREVTRGAIVACEPRGDSGPLPEAVRPTKLQLAAEMVIAVARRFPKVRFRVIADHAYNGRALVRTVCSEVTNVEFVLRGHEDAALFELPKPREASRPGRPAVKGVRLPNPEQWAAANARAFRSICVTIYGKPVTLLAASFTGMTYRTLPGRLVRYVITKDPRRIYRTAYFMSTDLTLTDEQVVTAFAHRWPLEQAFKDAKQKLGMQQPQTQMPASVRRTAPFAMLVYTLVVYWYLTEGHEAAQRLADHRAAWDRAERRPSFADMLAALRRMGWARAFVDPALRATKRSKMLEAYLAQVAAAA